MVLHRNAWIAWMVLVVLMGSAALAAQRGIVKFKDGRPAMEGDVEEKTDSVTVSRPAGDRNIQIEIPRDAIASIEYVGNLEAEYNAKVAKLDPKDVKGRLDLARWAFDRRKWDWARAQAEAALAIEPNSKEATDLRDTISLQIRLEMKTPPTTGKAPPTTTTDVRPVGTVEQRFLTAEQINRIRQKEIITDREKNLSIDVNRDLQRRFTNAVNIEASKFAAYKPIEQWKEIEAHRNQKFIDEVKIRSDPASMLAFRSKVLPTVIAGCSSANCHGGPQGGGLILYPATNDESTYTNFYILQQYSRKIEPVQPTIGKGPVAWKMIDRTQPAQSLLLQYGLPTDIADADHPQVSGWKPLFANARDQRYVQVIDWIQNSLSPIEPEYGIQYTPPKVTTRPAGK